MSVCTRALAHHDVIDAPLDTPFDTPLDAPSETPPPRVMLSRRRLLAIYAPVWLVSFGLSALFVPLAIPKVAIASLLTWAVYQLHGIWRAQRYRLRNVILAVIIINAGMISVVSSRQACVRHAASSGFAHVSKDTVMHYWPIRQRDTDRRASPAALKAWRANGYTCKEIDIKKWYRTGCHPEDRYPNMYVGEPRMCFPFLARVPSGERRSRRSGRGGSEYYLCLFGWAVPLGGRTEWGGAIAP
jgi:hypothetical protein